MKFDAELLYKECCKENPDVELIKDIIQNLHKIYGKSDYVSEEDFFRCLLFFFGSCSTR